MKSKHIFKQEIENIWSYSFVYAFILVNSLVNFLIIESINIHFGWNKSQILSYFLSLIFGYILTVISKYTIGSKGLFKSKLDKSPDELSIKFVNGISGFFICSLLAVILKESLSLEITTEVVNSARYLTYPLIAIVTVNVAFIPIYLITSSFMKEEK